MAVDPRTDRERLTTKAYANSDALCQRIGLYDYQLDATDLRTWVFDQLEIRHAARLVDAGCGPGRYLDALRERRPDTIGIGFDLSDGMAREAAVFGPTAVADATQLAVRTAGADVVLGAHMLYHVDDMSAAIDEFARVARPDGTVGELSMLSRDERRRVVTDWNDSVVAYPADATLVSLMSAQAALSPDATAVVAGDT